MVVDNCCSSIFKLTDNLIYLMLMISLVSRLLYSGTWHNSSTVNITVEDFCQNKYKKTLTRFLWSCASNHQTIVSVTVEELCQRLLNNHPSDCWRIMPVTVEESYQWLLNKWCQQLLKNHACEWWRIVQTTVEQPCQKLLKIGASDCKESSQ